MDENLKIRKASRAGMIELLSSDQNQNGEFRFKVRTAIMQTEILDEHLEEKLRSNKVIEGLLRDIRAEIERSAAPARDQDQAGPGQHIAAENNNPHKCSICSSADYQLCGCEAKAMIIKRHADSLDGIQTRHQVIASAKIFVDWIKVDLAKALGCKVNEVPAKLADWMGFTEKEPGETAAEEKNTEK